MSFSLYFYLIFLFQRDHFKEKCSRLNTQLSYALHNDDRRIVDIDALVLENKYVIALLTSACFEQGHERSFSFQNFHVIFCWQFQ